jgi:hypothetical protein
METVTAAQQAETSVPQVAWRYAEFGNHRVYFQHFGEGWRGLIAPLNVRPGQRSRTRSVYGESLEDVTRKAEDYIRHARPIWSAVARSLEAPAGLLRLGQGRDYQLH